MAFEQRENSGNIFKNDREGRLENAPGYSGTCLIAGIEYYISAWVKEGKKGKFFSLSFKPKGETGQHSMKQARAATESKPGWGGLDLEGFGSDIPF